MARSEVSYTYDADTAFRAPGSAALTATGEVGTFTLDKLANAREGSQKNKLGAERYAIVLVVSAIDTVEGTETYTFDVEVTDVGGGNGAEVVSFAVDAVGQWVYILDANTIEKLSAAATGRGELALNLTVGGTATTESITLAAWVAPA